MQCGACSVEYLLQTVYVYMCSFLALICTLHLGAVTYIK